MGHLLHLGTTPAARAAGQTQMVCNASNEKPLIRKRANASHIPCLCVRHLKADRQSRAFESKLSGNLS
jgi:hypothetical protein